MELKINHTEGQSKEKGYMAYQDVEWTMTNMPLSFKIRYTIFSTDSYETSIYAYEDDVLYSFSAPALNEEGSRYYLLMGWTINENISTWLRYASSKFDGEGPIGSGLTAINDNHSSEIKAMLRFKF